MSLGVAIEICARGDFCFLILCGCAVVGNRERTWLRNNTMQVTEFCEEKQCAPQAVA